MEEDYYKRMDRLFEEKLFPECARRDPFEVRELFDELRANDQDSGDFGWAEDEMAIIVALSRMRDGQRGIYSQDVHGDVTVIECKVFYGDYTGLSDDEFEKRAHWEVGIGLWRDILVPDSRGTFPTFVCEVTDSLKSVLERAYRSDGAVNIFTERSDEGLTIASLKILKVIKSENLITELAQSADSA